MAAKPKKQPMAVARGSKAAAGRAAPARKPRRITADMFIKHASCPHWVYFDAHGDPKKRAPRGRFTEMLLRNGLLNEEKALAVLGPCVTPKGVTEAARAADTLRLMREGAARIYHGTLVTPDFAGVPDLLERRDDRPSDLGAWHYAPVDIKSTEKLSDAHRYQLTLYAELLRHAQGARPLEGCILTGSGARLCFPIAEFDAQYGEAVAAIRTALDGDCPPPHLSSGCKQSPWFGQCRALAEKTDDVALLYNVKRKTILALREQGVKTVRDAANIIPERFPKSRYIKHDLLERVRVQAECLIEKRHVMRRRYILPEPPLELFFDIEGDPLRRVEYLFGFWQRDAKTGHEDYLSLLAEKPEHEGAMWAAFLAYCAGLPPDFAVYHYGAYEVSRLKSLGAKYGGSPHVARFMERMVDLNEVVKECVVFPLYFYGIKDIGGYIDFKREGKIVGGGDSVAYYEEWLEKGSRRKLNDILLYNEEDVRATAVLKDWLVHEALPAHDEAAP